MAYDWNSLLWYLLEEVDNKFMEIQREQDYSPYFMTPREKMLLHSLLTVMAAKGVIEEPKS